MSDDNRKVALIVGALAAAAGVAVASYLVFRRQRHADEQPLRTVSEVLTDCYSKIRDLQRHLADLHPQALNHQSNS